MHEASLVPNHYFLIRRQKFPRITLLSEMLIIAKEVCLQRRETLKRPVVHTEQGATKAMDRTLPNTVTFSSTRKATNFD